MGPTPIGSLTRESVGRAGPAAPGAPAAAGIPGVPAAPTAATAAAGGLGVRAPGTPGIPPGFVTTPRPGVGLSPRGVEAPRGVVGLVAGVTSVGTPGVIGVVGLTTPAAGDRIPLVLLPGGIPEGMPAPSGGFSCWLGTTAAPGCTSAALGGGVMPAGVVAPAAAPPAAPGTGAGVAGVVGTAPAGCTGVVGATKLGVGWGMAAGWGVDVAVGLTGAPDGTSVALAAAGPRGLGRPG